MYFFIGGLKFIKTPNYKSEFFQIEISQNNHKKE